MQVSWRTGGWPGRRLAASGVWLRARCAGCRPSRRAWPPCRWLPWRPSAASPPSWRPWGSPTTRPPMPPCAHGLAPRQRRVSHSFCSLTTAIDQFLPSADPDGHSSNYRSVCAEPSVFVTLESSGELEIVYTEGISGRLLCGGRSGVARHLQGGRQSACSGAHGRVSAWQSPTTCCRASSSLVRPPVCH